METIKLIFVIILLVMIGIFIVISSDHIKKSPIIINEEIVDDIPYHIRQNKLNDMLADIQRSTDYIRENRIEQDIVIDTPQRYMHNMIDDIGNYILDEIPFENIFPIWIGDDIDRTVPTNDPQNTHDSGVVSSIKTSLNKLKNVVGNEMGSYENNLSKIKSYFTKKDNKTKLKIYGVIDKITNGMSANGMSCYDNMTHKELLSLTNKYIEKQDYKTQENLKESLGQQLVECYENDKIVCPTGIFNRIINTFNGLTDDVKIQPEWALRREMLDKTPIHRANFDIDFSKKYNIEKNDIENHEKYNDELGLYIRDKLEHEYSDLLSKKKINDEIDTWNLF